MHRSSHLRWLTAILMALFVLSGCQPAPAMPAAAPTTTLPPAATATVTVPAPTLTQPPAQTAAPTKAVMPKAAPTATLPPVVTPLPGMVMFTHPLIPDHVFQVDPDAWMLDPYFYGDPQFNFLRHRTLTNCRIVPTQGRGGREDVITRHMGLYDWEILFYKPGNPYQPALGGPLAITFYNYTKKDCEQSINQVLKNLVYAPGAERNSGYQAYQTPVPQPTVAGFACSMAGPVYFKVGDQVRLLTDAVYLRSAPNQEENSKVTRLTRDKDWQIEITGGPECGHDTQKGDKAFWQVQVTLPGQPEQIGWLAQGDGYEPYLVPVE